MLTATYVFMYWINSKLLRIAGSLEVGFGSRPIGTTFSSFRPNYARRQVTHNRPS